MTIETKNAIVKRVSMSSADHGILSAWLHLDYGGSGQGFGGYALYAPHNKSLNKNNYAGHFIWRCMEIAGVTEWQDMVGKTIRVKSGFDRIQAIGHIVKDDWFDPKEEFDKMSSPT